MDWTFLGQQVFGEAINKEIKTQDGKERYHTQMCCSSEHHGGMFIIQACTYSKIFAMQWPLRDWKVHISFGIARIYTCYEQNFQ